MMLKKSAAARASALAANLALFGIALRATDAANAGRFGKPDAKPDIEGLDKVGQSDPGDLTAAVAPRIGRDGGGVTNGADRAGRREPAR